MEQILFILALFLTIKSVIFTENGSKLCYFDHKFVQIIKYMYFCQLFNLIIHSWLQLFY